MSNDRMREEAVETLRVMSLTSDGGITNQSIIPQLHILTPRLVLFAHRAAV